MTQGNRREEIKEQRRVIETALQQEYAARRVHTVDEQGRAYATGKRKTSVARVWIWEGPGSIQINGRSLDMCFPQLNRRAEILSPFQVLPGYGLASSSLSLCSATLWRQLPAPDGMITHGMLSKLSSHPRLLELCI